jgi:hypothetical protein
LCETQLPEQPKNIGQVGMCRSKSPKRIVGSVQLVRLNQRMYPLKLSDQIRIVN